MMDNAKKRAKKNLVIDNDGGYWATTDNSSDNGSCPEMSEKYGDPDGYDDVVDILIAAGVNAEWV